MTCLSPDAFSQVKISDASRSYLGQRTKPLLSYWWHATFITAAVWMLTSATTAGRLEASIQKQTAEPAAAHLRMGRKRAVAPPAIAEGQPLRTLVSIDTWRVAATGACVAQQIFTNLLTRPAELFYNLWAGPMTRTAKSPPRARSMTC